MQAPSGVSLLIAVEPFLLASALAELAELHGYRVRLKTTPSVQEHVCVSVVDERGAPNVAGSATVRLPARLEDGPVTVDAGGQRNVALIARPAELMELAAAIAAQLSRCPAQPPATV